MIVLLSKIPFVFLRNIIKSHHCQNILYLGFDQKIHDNLGLLKQEGINVLDYARELYEVSEIKRNSFVEWIDQVTSQKQSNLEWFFSPPAVKNPYASDLYLNICYFYVLEKLKLKQKIDLVIVDSPAFAEIIKQKGQIKQILSLVDILALLRWNIKKFILFWLRLFRFIWESFSKYLVIKLILRKRLNFLKDYSESILIRTYIDTDFQATDAGMMEKHYFPGLYDFLIRRKLNPVYFPICLTAASFLKTFNQVKNSKIKVIFPDEFLRFQDFCFAWTTWFRALKTKLNVGLLEGVDFSKLLKEEYVTTLSERGLLGAMLLSRVGERMKQHGFVPKSMVNWYENQAIEKGLIKGLRHAFTNIKIIGSQSLFTAPNHISLFPSKQDQLNCVVPDRILVLGDVGKKLVSQFLPGLTINYSLPFRYQKILESSHGCRQEAGNLLVLLGYGLADSLNIMRTLLEKSDQLKIFKKVLIKIHPAGYFNQSQLLTKLGQSLPEGWEFISGALEQCFNKVSVGISGATGAAVNMLACGIPTVVIAPKNILTMSYLVMTMDSSVWRMCFNSSEVLDAVKYFREDKSYSAQELKAKGQKLAQSYFAPSSEKYWENYLF